LYQAVLYISKTKTELGFIGWHVGNSKVFGE
jgi:hypothetical protein